MEAAQEIIKYISETKKQTPVKVYIRGNDLPDSDKFHIFGDKLNKVLIGEISEIQKYLNDNNDKIIDSYCEYDRRNSAIPLLDTRMLNARIEPGAFIREKVTIGENAVVMMGAIINIGAKVGNHTIIDMGAVLGGRVEVGCRCHIGAGAVLAGVIEPPSSSPVKIGDDVLIGANAVIVEGVHIGSEAVIGAGSIVLNDVPSGAVVVGNPAKVIKIKKSEKTKEKTQFVDELRKI